MCLKAYGLDTDSDQWKERVRVDISIPNKQTNKKQNSSTFKNILKPYDNLQLISSMPTLPC